MAYLSQEEKEMLYYAKKRYREGKCFFCGRESEGLIHILEEDNMKELPRWKKSFYFCGHHKDTQYYPKRINAQNARKFASIVGTLYDLRWF